MFEQLEITEACNYYAGYRIRVLKESKKYEDYPPISLITKEFIRGRFYNDEDATAINSWRKKLGEHMYLNNPCLRCRDMLINKTDWLMPFLFLPPIFGLFWLLVLIIQILEIYPLIECS